MGVWYKTWVCTLHLQLNRMSLYYEDSWRSKIKMHSLAGSVNLPILVDWIQFYPACGCFCLFQNKPLRVIPEKVLHKSVKIRVIYPPPPPVSPENRKKEKDIQISLLLVESTYLNKILPEDACRDALSQEFSYDLACSMKMKTWAQHA